MAALSSILVRSGPRIVSRNVGGFHSSSASLVDEKWKSKNNIPLNPQHNHEFKEWPDYSFVDGRPTPLSSHQYNRWKIQRELSAKVVQLLGDVDYAFEKARRLEKEEELEKQRKLDSKLKSKGSYLPKN